MNKTEIKVAKALLATGKIYAISKKDFNANLFGIKDKKATNFILKNMDKIDWENSRIWSDSIDTNAFSTFDDSSDYVEAIGGYVIIGDKKYYVGSVINALDAAMTVAEYYNAGA